MCFLFVWKSGRQPSPENRMPNSIFYWYLTWRARRRRRRLAGCCCDERIVDPSAPDPPPSLRVPRRWRECTCPLAILFLTSVRLLLYSFVFVVRRPHQKTQILCYYYYCCNIVWGCWCTLRFYHRIGSDNGSIFIFLSFLLPPCVPFLLISIRPGRRRNTNVV